MKMNLIHKSGILPVMLIVSLCVVFSSCAPESISKAPAAEPLYAYKNAYVGNNSNTVGLLGSLPYGSDLIKTTLHTSREPYGITAQYDFLKYDSIPEAFTIAWRDNAAIIFALIDNVGVVNFASGESIFYKATREEIQADFSRDLLEYSRDEATFSAFLNELKEKNKPEPTTTLLMPE